MSGHPKKQVIVTNAFQREWVTDLFAYRLTVEDCVSDADPTPQIEPKDGSDAKVSRAERKAELNVQKDKKKKEKAAKGSLRTRMVLFFRQTVAELRKVIWPTRKELISYTWVVLVFITVMAAIIGVMDLVFAKGVLMVFGS